jgi:hypothetical protein
MTKRPPTPTGWSDTDWVKKLQDDEENPLACLHINQGSFDAAADAYEEEYKMSKRTAMDVALDLDAAACSSFVKLEAAAMLRQQHAEIERLRKIAAHVPASVYIKAKETAGYGLSVRSLEFDPKGFAHRPDCYGLNIDTHCMGCTMAEREAHAIEFERLKRERHHIYDLLARIHRDGGQYAAEVGVEKACDDAEAQVVSWLDTINGIDALIEQARIAERAAHSMLIAAAHASLFAVDEDVASIIMLALDTVQKATGEKP